MHLSLGRFIETHSLRSEELLEHRTAETSSQNRRVAEELAWERWKCVDLLGHHGVETVGEFVGGASLRDHSEDLAEEQRVAICLGDDGVEFVGP
jgi:hypothetical protein